MYIKNWLITAKANLIKEGSLTFKLLSNKGLMV